MFSFPVARSPKTPRLKLMFPSNTYVRYGLIASALLAFPDASYPLTLNLMKRCDQLAELLKGEIAVASPLGKVLGKDAALHGSLLASIEKLVCRAGEMEAITVKPLP